MFSDAEKGNPKGCMPEWLIAMHLKQKKTSSIL